MKYFVVFAAAGLVAVTVAAVCRASQDCRIATDVVGYRFGVETATGKVLVDIGPKGADQVVIKRDMAGRAARTVPGKCSKQASDS
jgi:hypothetical protein